MHYTLDQIKEKLKSSDKWLIAGLLSLEKLQTFEEQSGHYTKEINNQGFNKFDAPFLSSLADGYRRYGRLTPRQIFALRKSLIKYSGQLLYIANANAEAKAAQTNPPEQTNYPTESGAPITTSQIENTPNLSPDDVGEESEQYEMGIL